MEMLLKKEIGTANVIVGGISFVRYPLSGNSHPSSAKKLTSMLRSSAMKTASQSEDLLFIVVKGVIGKRAPMAS